METTIYYETDLGKIIHGNSLEFLEENIKPNSVDLIMTSPPFGLVRKKDYGNVDAKDYLDWFRPFGEMFRIGLEITCKGFGVIASVAKQSRGAGSVLVKARLLRCARNDMLYVISESILRILSTQN